MRSGWIVRYIWKKAEAKAEVKAAAKLEVKVRGRGNKEDTQSI
jgi:hypothetical protein